MSKYAKDLVIADNGVRISPDPKTWKCADSGMTENLWLNLRTYIGSDVSSTCSSIDYTFLSINYNAQFKGTED